MSRIDSSDISTRCLRSDHNIQRLVNDRRMKAHEKHGENSIESEPADSPRWLAILGEEFGEVCHELTYDSGGTVESLADELLDVMAVASAWYDALRAEHGYLAKKETWLA